MEETKIVKAYCPKSNQYFSLELKNALGKWVVVNFADLTAEQASLICSQVKQESYDTDKSLLPCSLCGSRKVAGCNCSPKKHRCARGTGYRFDCVYCSNLQLDYSIPHVSRDKAGGTISVQGKDYKIVTFSNVKWTHYDNLTYHEDGSKFNEPKDHVIASEESIRFYGYNISAMEEGVRYCIGPNDDFSIECDVDTSTIQPHPGGSLIIGLGIISARLTENGGSFYIDSNRVASVGSIFHMKLSLIDGRYEVALNGKVVGTQSVRARNDVNIRFEFRHDSHYCELRSDAFIDNIKMEWGVIRQ